MKNALVLIVPACEKGRGGGHLIRSLLILQALKANGSDAFIWVPDYIKDDFLQRFRDFFNFLDSPCVLSNNEELNNRSWDFIVLDRFRTSKSEFKFFSSLATVIGIDEGGFCRDRFDFLIDLLPSLINTTGEKAAPNIFSPALLSLPRNRRPDTTWETASRFRVLISFGAEDSAGLGIAAARSISGFLAKTPKEKQLEVTLVSHIPPHNFRGEIEELPGINVMRRIPHLGEHLAEYDLFVTHFGLGAFEAVYARLPVILVSPSRYHDKLSSKAGFYSLGIGVAAAGCLGKLARDFGHRTEGNIDKRELIKTLEQKSREIADRYGLWEDQKETIASFLCRVSPRSPLVCPVCRKPRTVPVLARFPEESYRLCPHCGIIYLARLKESPVEYEKNYFFDDYKKQYGKTYLEDFPSLVETGKRRLEHIKDLLHLHDEKPSILDIGCAYGPFLAAAAQCGFSPAGVEPAPDAARYVKEELNFPCYQGFFPAAVNGPSGFDAVTLWYVIEHFGEVGGALREINGLLKEGGALAFSTPSFSGISGRKSLSSFLKNSPPDHFTVWSPRICAWILKRYGFRLRKIVVTGHHPERFPLLGRFADPAKKGPLYRFLLFISRLFRLGDTFEVYAVKK